MSKELYIAAHEELVSEYMDAHPGVSWTAAYYITADAAYERMKDRMADMADHYRDQMKERGR
jgi:hypothetical protein